MKGLPIGYSVDIGGSLEMTNKSIKLLEPTIPIILLIIMVLLMIQLQDLRNMALAISTAPLGLIGTSLALSTLYAVFFKVKNDEVIADMIESN